MPKNKAKSELFDKNGKVIETAREDLINALENNDVETLRGRFYNDISPETLSVSMPFVQEKGNLELVKFFLERGFDVDYRVCVESLTPLMVAINQRDEEAVKLYCSHGANLNARYYKGFYQMEDGGPNRYREEYHTMDMVWYNTPYRDYFNLRRISDRVIPLKALDEKGQRILAILEKEQSRRNSNEIAKELSGKTNVR